MVETVECVYSLWKRRVSAGLYLNDETHNKDLKNLVEVQPPGGDCLLVILRAETPRNDVSFTPPDQLLLNCYHSPTFESSLVDG
jgi:hypothetical protein